jgi:hypothetical protein
LCAGRPAGPRRPVEPMELGATAQTVVEVYRQSIAGEAVAE